MTPARNAADETQPLLAVAFEAFRQEFNLFPANKLCPYCKCDACYPLHRKGMDWPISLLGLRPARCLTCLRKFYLRYTIEESAAGAPTLAAKISAVNPKARRTESPDHPRAA